MDSDQDFEAFRKKFLSDQPSGTNRWAHVGALVAGAGGVAWAIRRRSIAPALTGAALAARRMKAEGHLPPRLP
jgi:hypothetical protein